MVSGKFIRVGIKLISFYVVSFLLVGVIIIQILDLISMGQNNDTDTSKQAIQQAIMTKEGRDVYAAAWGPSGGLQYNPKIAAGNNMSVNSIKIVNISVAENIPDFTEDSSDCDQSGSGSRIFILAAMRTGSSFLGEIFAQRNDFFYLFEPGKYLANYIDVKNISRSVLITRYLQLIEDVYKCDFSNSNFLAEGLSNETILGKKRFAPALLYSSGCHRTVNNFKRGKLKCDNPFPTSAITDACKSRRHIGIKSIRIPDINLLLHLMKRNRVNLKVIHIVRDPRGMVVSRLRVTSGNRDGVHERTVYNISHLTNTVKYYVQRYCLSWASNIEIGKYIPSVSTNYKLVRYEDLARDPVRYTRDIYSFVGLGSKIPFSVYRWIENNTGINKQQTNQSDRRIYSTSRNSRETYEAWRKSVRYDFVHYIQSIGDCNKLMRLAGYLQVPNENALSDPRRSFVTNIPDFNMEKYEYL